MRYMIGGQGWPVNNNGVAVLLPPSTIVDTSLPQWSWVGNLIPQDAVALDQPTMDYMVSYGTRGLGYPYSAVKGGPGVVGRGPS
jgi:hypothetical protein